MGYILTVRRYPIGVFETDKYNAGEMFLPGIPTGSQVSGMEKA